jgi:hypothetical protein
LIWNGIPLPQALKFKDVKTFEQQALAKHGLDYAPHHATKNQFILATALVVGILWLLRFIYGLKCLQ